MWPARVRLGGSHCQADALRRRGVNQDVYGRDRPAPVDTDRHGLWPRADRDFALMVRNGSGTPIALKSRHVSVSRTPPFRPRHGPGPRRRRLLLRRGRPRDHRLGRRWRRRRADGDRWRPDRWGRRPDPIRPGHHAGAMRVPRRGWRRHTLLRLHQRGFLRARHGDGARARGHDRSRRLVDARQRHRRRAAPRAEAQPGRDDGHRVRDRPRRRVPHYTPTTVDVVATLDNQIIADSSFSPTYSCVELTGDDWCWMGDTETITVTVP